jgi:hypothetical protein
MCSATVGITAASLFRLPARRTRAGRPRRRGFGFGKRAGGAVRSDPWGGVKLWDVSCIRIRKRACCGRLAISVWDVMTTKRDHSDTPPQRLLCPLRASGLYPTLVLALRDMRTANGRDEETGAGDGNRSWIGLALGMVVLDTLSGEATGVWDRWERLLTRHDVTEDDARLIYELRCSLLHGYGFPRSDKVGGRIVVTTGRPTGFAVDTSRPGAADFSVPLFCSLLVERIASEAANDWDVASINVDYPYFGPPSAR